MVTVKRGSSLSRVANKEMSWLEFISLTSSTSTLKFELFLIGIWEGFVILVGVSRSFVIWLPIEIGFKVFWKG
jgi:hypothetical protein